MNKTIAFGSTPACGVAVSDDCSSVSSYSNSLENESSSMSSDAILKAAMMLTARRAYPRRSAPTIATGRRNLKSEPVPREEAERRRLRRERNKVAATRCRQKRNEITVMLQRTVEQLEAEKRRDEEQLRALETMRNHLQFVLQAHESVCEQRAASHSHNHNLNISLGHNQNQSQNQTMQVQLQSHFANMHPRPQTLLFGNAPSGAGITPASELLAFADAGASMAPLVTLGGSQNRCFQQQLALGGAN